MNPHDEKIKRDNLEAFDKMLSIKENRDEHLQKRENCYVDYYGHKYLWTTHRQDDGKFHCRISKRKKGKFKKTSYYFTTTKKMSFVKRNTAKSWCLKNCNKACERQSDVLGRRTEAKEKRAEAKKAINTKNVIIEKKIKHFKQLQAKADTKIKSLTTRKKTYQKKIKYYEKKLI